MDIKKPDIDFKALLGKLALLKNHLNMLVPLLIAVVGGVLFVPAHIINAGLRKDIQSESLSPANTLKRLADEAVPERQWEVEQKYQKDYEKDSNAIAQWMKETSQRELLSYNLFPEPKTNSSFVFKAFGNQYLARLQQALKDLDAIRCPAPDELTKLMAGFGVTGGVGGMMGGENTYGRGRGVGRPLDATRQKVIDAICRDRAKSGHIYISPTALAGTSFWGSYQRAAGSSDEDAVAQCWYWQLGYWIISDVLDAVQACDEGTADVLNAPVKRLQTVQFSRPASLGTMGSAGGYSYGRGTYGEGGGLPSAAEDTESPRDPPKYVITPADYLTPSCTARVSNDQYDIIHFAVQAVVSASEVMKFQQELCSVRKHVFLGIDGKGPKQHFQHNQITILEIHSDAVDRNDPRHLYYRYGKDAVVSVTLVCEYLFDKAGYEPWIPKNVKSVFKQDSGQ